MIYSGRTHLSGLAAHELGVRLHRHCGHPALPAEHDHQPGQGPDARAVRSWDDQAAAGGQTTGRDFFGHCDLGAGDWGEAVL